jgi:hypothetical protein
MQNVHTFSPSAVARCGAAPGAPASHLGAFRGRGQDNFLFSHDLEECRLSPLELRNDLAAQFLELLTTSRQQRLPDLLETLRAITAPLLSAMVM